VKIIIASNNEGKIREFKQILEPLKYEVLSQSEAGINISVPETGDTFEQNALLKAKAIVERLSDDGELVGVIADDSGLCVDALCGSPGVYSADYDVSWLLEQLKGVKRKYRTARFVCCLCMMDKNGYDFVEGECEGWIAFEPCGKNGFGYDSVFMYGTKSFAEMSETDKNNVSHRRLALKKLKEVLK
jgi:XTP/dITP diphosphohydrolase